MGNCRVSLSIHRSLTVKYISAAVAWTRTRDVYCSVFACLGWGEFFQVILEGFQVVGVGKEEKRKRKEKKRRKRDKKDKKEKKRNRWGEKKRKNGKFLKMNGGKFFKINGTIIHPCKWKILTWDRQTEFWDVTYGTDFVKFRLKIFSESYRW